MNDKWPTPIDSGSALTRLRVRRAAFMIVLSLVSGVLVEAQRGGRGGGAPASARAGAAMELTGYWVSVITEDWKFRMVTPRKGVYETLTLSAQGRKVADGWDPARDEAAGEACRSYGAANIMRVPGRLNITWENDNTLRIDTDAGTQTRRLHFGATQAPPSEPTWQGHSVAQWQYGPAAGRGGGGGAPRTGSMKVITTNLRPGYVRKNGAPYGDKALVTEYFTVNTAPNGDRWLTVTTKVEDPQNFTRAYLTSSDFKQLPGAAGWNPTPCSAR
jgi:hypothetical protein